TLSERGPRRAQSRLMTKGERSGDRGVTVAWLAISALGLLAVVLSILAWPDLKGSDAPLNLLGGLAAVLYATLAGLILRRVRTPIGWVLFAEGAGNAILTAGSAYAVLGIATHPGSLPAAHAVGAAAQYVFEPTVLVLASILFVFPDGHLVSSRWRRVFAAWLAAAVVTSIGFVLVPAPIRLAAPDGVSLAYPNPLAIHGTVVPTLLVGAAWAVSLLTIAGFVSLVLRYRQGARELRQQVKWIALAAASVLVCMLSALG